MNIVNLQPEILDDEPRFLFEVEARLERALVGPGLLDSGARLAVFPGGKRARPRLAYRFADVTAPPRTALCDAAAAIELIHAASLVHDDILDQGELRRGQPTVRVALGVEPAVLAGDLLLCRALALLAPYPHEIARAAACFEEICRAATDEWEWRRRLELDAPTWRRLAEGKTGALFGLAAYVAASLAGDRERAARFDGAARALGVAFQIADDFADLDDTRRQEDVARDLRDGNPALPIVLALAEDRTLGEALVAFWRSPDAPVAPLVERVLSPTVRRASERAIQTEVETATRLLGRDGASPRLAPVLEWARHLANATRASERLA